MEDSQIAFRCSEELRRSLAAAAEARGSTLEDILAEFAQEWLERRDPKKTTGGLDSEERELLEFWRTEYPPGTVGYWARKMVSEALRLRAGQRSERIG